MNKKRLLSQIFCLGIFLPMQGFSAYADKVYIAAQDLFQQDHSEDMISHNKTQQVNENSATECVVLLHGIARTSRAMRSIEKVIAGAGYKSVNIDYPSTKHTLQDIVRKIAPTITRQTANCEKVHFIGYSMGGLVTRALIHENRPENLGRVVQLATPNHGSEIADLLKNFWPYKKIYGPAGQQLVTDKDRFDDILGSVDFELGIIAGNRTIDPVSSLIIPWPNDGKVSVESTKLNGMTDHIVVPANHTFFPQTKIVQQQAVHFLKFGHFFKK